MKRSPMKRTGARAKRNAAKDAAWRLDVLQRCGHTCVYNTDHCDAYRGLHAHHLYGRQSHAHLRHEPTNGVALCPNHHRFAHAKPKRTTEYFLSLLHPNDFARLQKLRKQKGKPFNE